MSKRRGVVNGLWTGYEGNIFTVLFTVKHWKHCRWGSLSSIMYHLSIITMWTWARNFHEYLHPWGDGV